MHNIETIRLRRELECPSSKGRWLVLQWDRFFFESWEIKAIRQFDGITVVSDPERMWVQQHVPAATVELVPNGVDTKYFYPTGACKAEPSVVFTGLMDHPPNIDAVVWFCNEILPALRGKLPGLRFKIVGARPHARVLDLAGREGVDVTGEVADIRPYLAESSALVVPLRSGGGTRLKILEAMAMGRPVISTTLGAEGLEVTPGNDVLIADSAEQFVGQILTLLGSPDMARRLGKAGRALVVEKYDWQFCLRRLEGLYDRLLSNESHPAPDLAHGEPRLGA